ncbi:MAG TPA: hypothetical protein VIH52_03755 [Candidatus Nanoarchaeia archaeon]|nr:hypothetical protein [uncultured archaeon]
MSKKEEGPIFGSIVSDETGNWFVDLNGLVKKAEPPWTEEEMKSFWAQVCSLMHSYGVTNRYPEKPTAKLVRAPEFKGKRLSREASRGIGLSKPITRLEGTWSKENCTRFQEEVSTLMQTQGLVYLEMQRVWIITPKPLPINS